MIQPLVKIYNSNAFAKKAIEKFNIHFGNKVDVKPILSELGNFNGYITYLPLDIQINNDEISFCNYSIKSSSLTNHFKGAIKATLFIATIGIKYDILLNKLSKTNAANAYSAQVLGMYLIEELCNLFEVEDNALMSEYIGISRFSPGYGDLSLENQKIVFELLKPEQTINVTLNSSLLMSPSKTVSAIIGYRK